MNNNNGGSTKKKYVYFLPVFFVIFVLINIINCFIENEVLEKNYKCNSFNSSKRLK